MNERIALNLLWWTFLLLLGLVLGGLVRNDNGKLIIRLAFIGVCAVIVIWLAMRLLGVG
jgi:hypothetical protein